MRQYVVSPGTAGHPVVNGPCVFPLSFIKLFSSLPQPFYFSPQLSSLHVVVVVQSVAGIQGRRKYRHKHWMGSMFILSLLGCSSGRPSALTLLFGLWCYPQTWHMDQKDDGNTCDKHIQLSHVVLNVFLFCVCVAISLCYIKAHNHAILLSATLTISCLSPTDDSEPHSQQQHQRGLDCSARARQAGCETAGCNNTCLFYRQIELQLRPVQGVPEVAGRGSSAAPHPRPRQEQSSGRNGWMELQMLIMKQNKSVLFIAYRQHCNNSNILFWMLPFYVCELIHSSKENNKTSFHQKQ